MWKPGEARPKKSQSPKTPAKDKSDGNQLPKSVSSSGKKRLTGATLNMRFMKRKKETEENAARSRKSDSYNSNNNQNNSNSPIPAPSPMCVETPDEQRENDAPFAPATSVDMYGMQASLIGRRSFGGFNPAMEDAWMDAKATIEDTQFDRKEAKVSDDELLKRYENIVKGRSDSSRPVGNLNGKSKKRKIRKSY